jgi:stage III sporulation protein AE
MKILLRGLCLLLFALLLAHPADALEWAELRDILALESVELAGSDETGELPLSPETDYGAALRRVVSEALAGAGGFFREGLRGALLLVLAAALVSLFSALWKPENGFDPASLVGVAVVGAAAAGDLRLGFGLGGTLLDRLNDLSKALLPCLTAATAFGGAVTSSAARYAAAALFMDVVLTAARTLLLPLIGAYLAAALASAAFEGEGTAAAAAFLKWLATSLLLVLGLGFVLYLSLSGLAAGAVDAAALRVTRTGLSTALPVVGGILSDAGTSILAGAELVKTTVGVFGLVAAAAVCLTPFLRLGVHYLLYKAAAALAGSLAGGKMGKAVSGAASAFALLMGTLGLCCLAFFFSLYSFMRAVT